MILRDCQYNVHSSVTYYKLWLGFSETLRSRLGFRPSIRRFVDSRKTIGVFEFNSFKDLAKTAFQAR